MSLLLLVHYGLVLSS